MSDKYEEALRKIAYHPHCNYENCGPSMYGIGVADGHRCAANIAREALCADRESVIAAKREEGAYRFYQALAALQPPGEIQAFLDKMAKVELQHKEKVEYLYDNAAFPEVW